MVLQRLEGFERQLAPVVAIDLGEEMAFFIGELLGVFEGLEKLGSEEVVVVLGGEKRCLGQVVCLGLPGCEYCG